MKSSIYKIFNLIIISSFSTFAIGQSLDLKDITSALGDLESPISKSKEEGSDEDQSDVEEMIKEEEDDLTSIVPDEDYLEIFQNLTDDQKDIILEEADRIKKFQELTPSKRKILIESIEDKESELTFDDKPNYKILDQKFIEDFGYDLFDNDTSPIKPVLNAAVPPEYVISQGDEVNIFLYGNDNDEFVTKVARNGSISIPGIGPIVVAGLTFSEMKEAINLKVASELIGTSSSISMGELSSIRIYILGEVKAPSSYIVSSLSTVTNALFLSGGVKESGSLRKISINRGGKIISNFDLYDLLLYGDNSGDIRLQQGDIIFIPSKGKTVSISGEVNRAFRFEVLEKDSITELLDYSGGFKPTAFQEQAQIRRITDNGAYKILDVDLSNLNELSNGLSQGDAFFIPSANESYEDSVIVSGSFRRPGFYQWKDGMTLQDLIEKSGGMIANADQKYLLLIREFSESSINIFQFDRTSNSFDMESQFLLKPKDKVVVFSRIQEEMKDIQDKLLEIDDDETAETYLEKQQLLQQIEYVENQYQYEFDVQQNIRRKFIDDLIAKLKNETSYEDQINTKIIFISGNVRFPGEYPYSQNMTIADALNAAGGLKENTFLDSVERTSSVLDFNRVKLKRLDVNLKDSNNYSQPINPGDQIVFKSANRLIERVLIEGEVFFPGEYSIEEGESLLSLINRAGGLTSKAFAKGAVFTRETLKEKEQDNLKQAAEQLRKQLILLSANADDTSNNAFQDQFILDSIQSEVSSAEAIGRLVFDLNAYLNDKSSEMQINLQNGDRIFIPEISNSVTVIGEVYSPGTFIFNSKQNMNDYLNLSGGPNPYASDNTYVIAANGTIKNTNSGGFFRGDSALEPGDTIVVPPRVEAFSALKTTQNATQIIYQLAVAAAAVSSFNN